jgi:hypothetical protein
MTVRSLQYIWDGKRIFVRSFAGPGQSGDPSELPDGLPMRYALFAELATSNVPPAKKTQDPSPRLILIGMFNFQPEMSFTHTFVPPPSTTRLRLGRVDAMGWKKDELIIELDPTLLPDKDVVRIQPFAIRFDDDNSRIYTDRTDEFEAPAKELQDVLSREEAAIGNRLVVAQIYYRRVDDRTTTPSKVTIGKLQVKRAQLDTMVRISGRRESAGQPPQLRPGLAQIQRSISLDTIDQIKLRISIPGLEPQHDSRELQKLLEQVYLIHIPLQLQFHNKGFSDLPRPMALPDSILAGWGAARIPSDRAHYNVECLTDAYRNESDNTSGIIARRNDSREIAIEYRRNAFSVTFIQAAICDIVGVMFAGGSTFSIVEDANTSSSREIAKNQRSAFFRVLDGQTPTSAEIDPHLREIDMEVRRRFRAESDTSSSTRKPDRAHSLMQIWIGALEPATGLDQSAIAHPLDAEAFADAAAIAAPNAVLRGWPPESQIELFSYAPALFEVALRNDTLAERLTEQMVTLRRNLGTAQSIPAILMLACGFSKIPTFSNPDQQTVAWELASSFELFERLCAAGIEPFDEVAIPDIQPRLNSLWNDGSPLDDWVAYAESPDAAMPSHIVEELRTLFDHYQKPVNVRGWFSLKEALKLADLLTLTRQAFVKQTGLPSVRDTATKRLDQAELVAKISELLRLVDHNTSMGLDVNHVKKRIKEKPAPPILLLEDWHNKLKTVLGSSEIDRNSDKLIQRLGEWAELGDAIANLSDQAIPIKERRENLSAFLRRASVIHLPRIDTVRASDKLGSARVRLHSELRTTLRAGLHGNEDVPELYRLADILLYHRVFTAINTLLSNADNSTSSKNEISKTTRYLALWPQRAEATVGLALSIENSKTPAGPNAVSDSLTGLGILEDESI